MSSLPLRVLADGDVPSINSGDEEGAAALDPAGVGVAGALGRCTSSYASVIAGE